MNKHKASLYDKTILEYIISYLTTYCTFEWAIHDIVEQARIDIIIQSAKEAPLVNVLIHDPKYSRLDANQFACELSFHKDYGVTEGHLEVWLGYIRQCAQQMISDYRQEGIWQWRSDATLFQTYLDTYKQLGKYKENIIPYIIRK
ncbi:MULTISPECIES: hypothetical protein [unclassified Granulicatella]|uniref:hypothetical protein n=1 Tax=unclassified Granulicatella TaxID=2630493 RepID=UPI00107477F7|nr:MULTISPECIES: hypothetical protein [unclassified Granulicatella]MBF0779493.1 hypothetical protein [Granulicatella sp. 19428wC4_WM01]TFU96459.1 hypothetical protein E4T68_00150 [Granulicatella sp. WM01]